jgi:hypothetical protein
MLKLIIYILIGLFIIQLEYNLIKALKRVYKKHGLLPLLVVIMVRLPAIILLSLFWPLYLLEQAINLSNKYLK